MSALEQIRWERDMAIKQLEEHGIPFCGMQEPLTLDDAFSADVVYIEWKTYPCSGIPKCIFHSELHEQVVQIQGFTGYEVLADISDYNKLWRCWRACPTDEECRHAKWECDSDNIDFNIDYYCSNIANIYKTRCIDRLRCFASRGNGKPWMTLKTFLNNKKFEENT